jgi:hypothetical protein
MMLTALEEYLSPPDIVVIRGEADETAAWAQTLARVYAPRRIVLAIAADSGGLPPELAAKAPGPRTRAYVCQGPQCSAPIEDLARLVRYLRDGVLTGDA